MEVRSLRDDTKADDSENLRVQLRQRYPDDAFERTIHWERGIEAEERRERALNGLARLMAEAVVEEVLSRGDALNVRGL